LDSVTGLDKITSAFTTKCMHQENDSLIRLSNISHLSCCHDRIYNRNKVWERESAARNITVYFLPSCAIRSPLSITSE